MKILFIHGWGGKRTHYWMPWLESQLMQMGHEVFAPQIPNSYNPKKTKWVNHIHEYVQTFKPDAVVTHSIGALAWWHFQARFNYPLKAQLFVAPPTHASFAKIESFFPLPEYFNHSDARVIASLDDTNIETKTLQDLCEVNQIKLHLLNKGAHFDPFSKQLTLPLGLDYLLEHLKV